MNALCAGLGLEGSYARLLDGVNHALDAVVAPLTESVSMLTEYAEGDERHTLRELPGQQVAFSDALNTIHDNLTTLIDQTLCLTEAAASGNLSRRGDPGRLTGAYRDVVEGFNRTLDGIIHPVRLTSRYLADIAQGQLQEAIPEDFPGDSIIIKDALLTSVQSIRAVVGATSTG